MSSLVFRVLVPFLILFAVALLAMQDRIKDWIHRQSARTSSSSGKGTGSRAILPVGLAAVYGGYFGAGLSVIVLAVLGLVYDDTLTRLSALKQCISLVINLAASVFFLFSGLILWPVALVMAAGAVTGGIIGGSIAGRIDPVILRWTVIVIGTAIGIWFLATL